MTHTFVQYTSVVLWIILYVKKVVRTNKSVNKLKNSIINCSKKFKCHGQVDTGVFNAEPSLSVLRIPMKESFESLWPTQNWGRLTVVNYLLVLLLFFLRWTKSALAKVSAPSQNDLISGADLNQDRSPSRCLSADCPWLCPWWRV